MTRRSILYWFALTLAALLLISLLLLAWGIGTASGTRLLWSAASGAIPGLQATVEGRLAGPLRIRDLRYEDEYRRLAIGSIELDWKPARLLRDKLHIQRLHVTDVDITQLKPSPPAETGEPFEIPASVELPVDLVLGDIALHKLAFRASPEAEPLLIDQATLAANFREHDLELHKLLVEGPLFTLQAVAQVVTRSGYATEATLDWEIRPAELAAATGRLTIAGGLKEMRLQHSLAPPYRLQQTATLTDIAGDLGFKAQTVIADLQLAQIGATLPAVAIDGQVNLSGTAQDIAVEADLNADSATLGGYSLAVRGNLREQVLTLSQLLLTGTEALRLQAGGVVELGGETPRIELQSQWQALRWPLAGEPQLLIAEGQGGIHGTLEDYAVELNSQLQVPGQTGGELQLTGRGSSEAFELSQLQLALLDGRLDGTGQVRWSPQVEGSIALVGEGLDPSVLVPDLPGNLQLEVRASGGLQDGTPAAQIDSFAVTGTLRERPLDLQLRGRLQAGIFELETIEMLVGATRLEAQGKLGDALDLDWLLKSPDLSDLSPQARGTIEAEGHIGGSLGQPALRAALQARDLRYGQYSLNTLSLDADVDLDRPAPSNLALTLSDGVIGDINVDRIRLTGAGTRSAHSLELLAETSAGDAELGIDGDLQDSAWVMQLTQGLLRYGELEPWILESPHPARITLDEQQLERGCWNSGQAQLCLQGQRGAELLSAEVDLKELALDYFQPLLPASIQLHGNLAAEARLEQRGDGIPSLNAELGAEGVELLSQAQGDQPGARLLALQPSRVTVDYSASGLNANLALPFVGEGGISGQAHIDQGTSALNQRPLRAGLALDLRDISFLTALSPEIEHAAGALSGKLELSGSLAEPLPQGELNLSDGELQLAAPGLELTGIELQARATDRAALTFTGGASSGGGALQLSGTARLDGPQTQADININGDSFQVVDTRDARVFVSPDLAIAVRDTGIRLSGEVVVPKAAITPRKLPPSAVSTSDDQIIIRGTGDSAEAAASSKVEADIRITLGDDVRVDGFGFKGRLSGGLVVRQEPGKPTVGTGELNIHDGEYRAYGQGLVVEQGKILFAGGPLDQPGISVRAVRRPDEDILVGVKVSGPVQAPDFEVFSEPGMSQTEQLSWLVLGRSLEGTSDGEGDMLAQAATMLGLKGGNFLADKFGDNLGVDSIGFETGSGEAGAASDVDQAAFVIGKYLSPDLYVSYGIGLFESVSTIKLEYTLDEHWKLSTESSTLSSGGDVIYTIEK